jgi:AcrR family transcriptional regulator
MEAVNRTRIVQAAYELFNIRGYKSVTISDLADRLSMSKKTIYLYFSSKEEIAAAVVEGVLNRITDTIETVEIQDGPPLELLENALNQIKNIIISVGPLFQEDVQKFLPDLWKRIETFRGEKLKFIERLLYKAQESGIVEGIDPHLAMVIFLESVQNLIRPDSVSRTGFAMADVLDAVIKIFSRGIIGTRKSK